MSKTFDDLALAVAVAEDALDSIGDGDWTPQDYALSNLVSVMFETDIIRRKTDEPALAAIKALHADKPRRRWLRRHGKPVEVYYTIQVPAHVPRNKLVTIAKFSDLHEARRVMAELVELGFDAIITYGDWKTR